MNADMHGKAVSDKCAVSDSKSGRLGRIIDRSFKKHWREQDIKIYVGQFLRAELCYANDPGIRQYAASGGTVSTLLIHGLENRFFDGAVVCQTVIEDGKVRAHFKIANTAEEVLEARGSKYVETKFLREVLPLVKSFSGRFAVTGLPCDIRNLSRWVQKYPEIMEKIALKISLVCGHTSRVELIDHIVSLLEKEAGQKIKNYRFRIGHWRGQIEATFADGSSVRKPSSFFNDYQNLFFFCDRKCLACHDHYGYDADISAGDVWLYGLKNNPIKHTGIIIRNKTGERVFDAAAASGDVITEPIDIRVIMDGQSRIGPFHYNSSARAKAGKFLGVKITDSVGEKVSWHSFLSAFIAILNFKISQNAVGKKLLFAIPRPLLKGYLYLKKGLESFR